MKLQRREKILAGAVIGIVGVAGLGFLVFGGDSRSYEQLIAQQTKLQLEVKNKEKQIQTAGQDAKRLTEWQRRALPPDPSLARSLYGDWLSKLAIGANLRNVTLVSPEGGTHRDQLTRLAFTLRARAKLGDLVEFMYGFYASGFLHQIRKMDVKPLSGSRDLDVNLTIEAISLSTAQSKDALPKDAGSVLKFTGPAAYLDPIVSRDFFSPYVRPVQRTPPPREKTVDPAEFAFVTGFTEVDGAAQVWIKDRLTNKPWFLATGETFAIGLTKGTVQSIRQEGAVVVEFEGHRRLLHLGDNLHGGVEMQVPPPNQPDEGVKSTRPVPNPGN